jgi:hypothetical protein
VSEEQEEQQQEEASPCPSPWFEFEEQSSIEQEGLVVHKVNE